LRSPLWTNGLKRLYAEDNARAVPPDTVDKIRKMLAFLDDGRPQGYLEPERHAERP